MIRRKKLAVICCCLLIWAACVRHESAPPSTTSPEKAVQARADKVDVRAGGSAEATVRLIIADGYHVNANPPTYSYLKATELKVAPAEGLTAGSPVYPSPVTKKFSFAEQPLAVYEKEAVISLPINAAATAPSGAHTLNAKLQAQACNNDTCFPPRTIEVPIPVTIKSD
jgi:thioredoxin:protein disulfide reductase